MNVLLVTLDTTRADHLGCYGNAEARTPTIDRLAADGVRFEHAYSAIPLTAPSHATILTGLYPYGHGVRDNGMFTLAEDQRTLAEILRTAGYRTAAAVGGFPLVARSGLDQGFDLYDDRVDMRYSNVRGERVAILPGMFLEERPAAWVNESVFPWLENGDEPFFLWVHYYDPHFPLIPPFPYSRTFESDLYAGEISYADEQLGVLLQRLRRLGVTDDTLIIVVADHGEGLDEHQERTHSFLLYDTTLRVPLIIRVPGGRRGAVVDEAVGTVDLLPTVLDLLDLPAPDDLHGRSLARLLTLGDAWDRPPAELYAETLSPRLTRGWGELRSLRVGRHKLVVGPRPELFDVELDPLELDSRYSADPATAQRLTRRLAARLSRVVPVASSQYPIDEETRRKLMALGYLSGGGGSQRIREEIRTDGDAPQDHAADVSAWSTARNLLVTGHPADAAAIVRPLLAKSPNDRLYQEILAAAMIDLDRLEDARQLIDDIMRSHPAAVTNPELPLRLGVHLAEAGDPVAGLELLSVAERIRPSSSIEYLRAQIEAGRARPDAALIALERTLELDPHLVGARIDLAVNRAQRGELVLAERELRRAVADDPYAARAWYNLGVLGLERSQVAAAVAHLRRAIEIRPDYLQARYALVEALVELGREQEAWVAADELQRLAPASAEAEAARRLLGEAA